jgi:hypothetical protein
MGQFSRGFYLSGSVGNNNYLVNSQMLGGLFTASLGGAYVGLPVVSGSATTSIANNGVTTNFQTMLSQSFQHATGSVIQALNYLKGEIDILDSDNDPGGGFGSLQFNSAGTFGGGQNLFLNVTGSGAGGANGPLLSLGDELANADASFQIKGQDATFYMGYDDTSTNLKFGKGSAVGTNVILTMDDDSLTVGDGAAVDTKIVFDGNEVDMYMGLDDGTNKLLLGVGSAVGTTPNMTLNSGDRDVAFSGDITVEGGKVTLTNGSTIDSETNGTLLLTEDIVKASADLTAGGTLIPEGDTAAADAAAVGYTAAEGIIITGQGSTSDVTLKNDADATVLTIATGTTNVDVVGDVTAATLNADGDTAAGDDAAIGYTSAEGIIITGQGSTSDVTIKNDADAAVLTVATGTTNVDVVGDLTAAVFMPDGDTTTGDAAAVGYTSVEGIIITGQGSTYDVTLKNDADAAVMGIPTGGTQANFLGAVDVVGDLTAATLNADGDTSAGDAAAVGYTSVEGIIITGQGSTNDVTIKNDADAAVISIPTGGLQVNFAGGMQVASTIVAQANATIATTLSVGGILTADGQILSGYNASVAETGLPALDLANAVVTPDGDAGTVIAVNSDARAVSLNNIPYAQLYGTDEAGKLQKFKLQISGGMLQVN